MAKHIDSWETIVKAIDLPSRSIKHVEIKEKEIAEINLDGKYNYPRQMRGHEYSAFKRRD